MLAGGAMVGPVWDQLQSAELSFLSSGMLKGRLTRQLAVEGREIKPEDLEVLSPCLTMPINRSEAGGLRVDRIRVDKGAGMGGDGRRDGAVSDGESRLVLGPKPLALGARWRRDNRGDQQRVRARKQDSGKIDRKARVIPGLPSLDG
jgi:hypothetical protein